jgi:signal transduction histidine kinase
MRLMSRISRVLLAVPVFVKVMGIALGTFVLLGGGMLWQIHKSWQALALRDLERRGRVIANDIAARAAPLMRAGDTVELQHVLEQVRDGIAEVGYLVVHDAAGNALARVDAGTPIGAFREITIPIAAGATGDVRVGMREDHVIYEVGWFTRRLARTTLVIGALGMVAAWWLTRLFTRPIRELVNVTRAVQHGNLKAQAPVLAHDEIGDLAVAFNDMIAAMQEKDVARRELQRQAISAAEEERKRLARELHDQTGQQLTALIAGLGALEPCAPDVACATKLRELRGLASQTLSDVHAVSVVLRPHLLDDLGLVAAIRKHLETTAKQFAVATDLQVVGVDNVRLPAETELTLYRIVQEALTNAIRHGAAHAITVLLHRRDEHMLLVVEDDGHGFDPEYLRQDTRLGLLGIEERVALLGGTMRLESRPAAGTTLLVEVPCPKSAS